MMKEEVFLIENHLRSIIMNPNTNFISLYEMDIKSKLLHLYGAGIGFPEIKKDPIGNIEKKIGIPSFIHYAQNTIPLWIAFSKFHS